MSEEETNGRSPGPVFFRAQNTWILREAALVMTAWICLRDEQHDVRNKTDANSRIAATRDKEAPSGGSECQNA
ncbi:MAG TPA: hypothetical protein VFB23_04000 [Candidatus Acidoferrales bacterium]|jgi:hypothetical protein|nr:hypothetical protein [Candidatus Acidoferrales bacterium]